MSYDILQSPTNPNLMSADLVYSVSSSNAGQPQFRYVFKVDRTAFGTEQIDVKFYPNQYGIGTADLSRVARNVTTFQAYWQRIPVGLYYIVSDYVPGYTVEYGEEYAATFNDNPSYVSRGTLDTVYLLDGFTNINDNEEDGYNWNAQPYIITSASVDTQKPLTTSPYYIPFSENYKDAKFPRQYVPRDYSIGAVGALHTDDDFFDVTVIGRDVNDNVISVDNIAQIISVFDEYSIGHFKTTPPFSPTLMPNFTANIDNIKYYQVYINGTDGNLWYYFLDDCEIEGRTSFMWLNQFGAYDSYFVSNPVRKTNNVDRSTYDKTFVRYDDCNSSYDISNRGKKQYMTQYETIFEVTTDYLTEEEAKWFSGLFESKASYVSQYIDEPDLSVTAPALPIGITILNSSYQVNNSTARNKLFQYTIQFKYNTQYQSR